jgi:hypothetical protein
MKVAHSRPIAAPVAAPVAGARPATALRQIGRPAAPRQARRAALSVRAVAAPVKPNAPGAKAVPAVTSEEAKMLYRDMVLGREFEEMCAQMYYRGKMFGFVHLYSGQEAVATGARRAHAASIAARAARGLFPASPPPIRAPWSPPTPPAESRAAHCPPPSPSAPRRRLALTPFRPPPPPSTPTNPRQA